MRLAHSIGLTVAAVAAVALTTSAIATDKGIDHGSGGPPVVPPDPPEPREDVIIRISQETAPGANDFAQNVLGEILPFRCRMSAGQFYGYDVGCYNGCFVRLNLTPDRSHLFLADTNEGMTLMIVHDSEQLDQDGGSSEMLYQLFGDPDGAYFSVFDDPDDGVNRDRYDGTPGSSVFASVHDWAPPRTDGEALSAIDGEWSMLVQFLDVDGDPSTPTIEGLTEWFATSANGEAIALALEPGRRVLLEYVPDCTLDVVENGNIDFDDLLMILANWGPCP